MKIVILNGSPRKQGSTAYILHLMEETLRNKNAETIYYDLYEEKIEPCRGCCVCYKTGCCFIRDSSEKISREISEADGIIIGSPTYASNVSGTLKNFIDRGHFVIEQLLHDKYAISVAIYENYGGGDTKRILNKLLNYSGAIVSDSLTIKISFSCSNISQLGIDKKIRKSACKLHNDIAVRKKHRLQKIKNRFIFKIGIKPFVIGKGAKYIGVLNKWKENGFIK